MITTLFNNPRVLYQTDEDQPNEAIAASIDNGNSIVLEQEGRHIVIDPDSVPELCKMLKELAKLAKEES